MSSSNQNDDRNLSNDRSNNGDTSTGGDRAHKDKFREQGQKGILDKSINENNSLGENRQFQNGKETMKFDEFLGMIKDNCSDPN